MAIETQEIGSFVEDILRDAFNDAGLSYNGQAFARIGQIVQDWADDGTLTDGNLDIGDYA